MTDAPGYNPLRWNCLEQGCFNWKKRPKIECFAACLPGKIGFGDIDAITEIGGNALLLEWKEVPKPLATGQRLMYERLTADGRLTAFLLAGDARQMGMTHCAWYLKGQLTPWQPATLDYAQRWITRWAQWAQCHPVPAVSAPIRLVK